MAELAQKLTLPQMQTKWASQLNPLLSKEITKGQLLQDIVLINGKTVVNHKLGRPLIGYWVVLKNAAAEIYDSQDTNQMPQLTLVLNSNAAVTVSLWVF